MYIIYTFLYKNVATATIANYSINVLSLPAVRKDIVCTVNEHDRLEFVSNCMTQIKVKELSFYYCCSTFQTQ